MNFNSILIGSENPKELAEFYTKVFGKPTMDDSDNGWYGWTVGQGFLSVGPHSEVKGKNPSPGRILINFETKDVQGEFDRIKAAGAKVVAEPYHPGDVQDATLATFADPDGNYFQLNTPWKS